MNNFVFCFIFSITNKQLYMFYLNMVSVSFIKVTDVGSWSMVSVSFIKVTDGYLKYGISILH